MDEHQNTFVAFLKYRYKIKDQTLTRIPPKFASELYNYLTLTNSIGNNTAMKYVKNLKLLIKEAVIQGWLTPNPIESYKCNYIDPERQALTLEEIAKIIDHKFDHPRLGEVRDVFIFCCFTGFAYQEVYNLRPKDLTLETDGKNWINTTRNKNQAPRIPPPPPYCRRHN